MTNNAQMISVRDRLVSFERAISAKEAAGVLGVSAQLILKEARRGNIPHFRIGTSVLFDPKSLVEWLERQTIDLHAELQKRKGRA
jgi:excisionase family DNA binding protein